MAGPKRQTATVRFTIPIPEEYVPAIEAMAQADALSVEAWIRQTTLHALTNASLSIRGQLINRKFNGAITSEESAALDAMDRDLERQEAEQFEVSPRVLQLEANIIELRAKIASMKNQRSV